MDCGVAGYDNTFGLPPFFPTRLRFEDYIYRLWVQQDGIAAAHVDAAQNHIRSNYMRNPPAGGDLQRGGVQPAQAEDQGHALAPRRAEHRVRLRGRGDGAGRRGDPRQDRPAVRAGAGGGRGGDQPGAGRRRCGCSPPTCRRRSTASSRTSSSRTCCGSWTTSSASSRARSSCGRRWSRSATSRRAARACRRSGSTTRRSERPPMATARRSTHENRTSRPPYESVPPEAVRRHGARRLLPDRGAGAAGARGHAVRQRRLGDEGEAGRRLPAGPVARPGLPGDAAAPRPADGAGLRGCLPLRRHPLPLRLPALPPAAALPLPERDDAARAAARPGPGAAVRGVPRGAAGLHLRRSAPADPRRQLAGDRLSRAAAGPAHLPRAARRVPRVPRPHVPREARRSRHRDRAPGRHEAQDRRQDLSGGTRLLPARPSSRCCASRGAGSSSSARSAAGRRTSSWATPAPCSSRSTGRSRSAW